MSKKKFKKSDKITNEFHNGFRFRKLGTDLICFTDVCRILGINSAHYKKLYEKDFEIKKVCNLLVMETRNVEDFVASLSVRGVRGMRERINTVVDTLNKAIDPYTINVPFYRNLTTDEKPEYSGRYFDPKFFDLFEKTSIQFINNLTDAFKEAVNRINSLLIESEEFYKNIDFDLTDQIILKVKESAMIIADEDKEVLSDTIHKKWQEAYQKFYDVFKIDVYVLQQFFEKNSSHNSLSNPNSLE